MTLESRLRDTLREADRFGPSPDLFARVERSITEDLAHRRRVWAWLLGGVAFALAIVLYLWATVETSETGSVVVVWRVIALEKVILVAVMVALAPNIRRFARSYVSEVFHMSPDSGPRFLRVLDLAYYLFFSGLILLDTTAYGPWLEPIAFGGAAETLVGRVALFAGAMGVLHVVNVATLPVIGLIFNSLVRRALRAQAGDAAPPESPRSRRADSNAQAAAIVLVVLALFAVTLVASVPGVAGLFSL